MKKTSKLYEKANEDGIVAWEYKHNKPVIDVVNEYVFMEKRGYLDLNVSFNSRLRYWNLLSNLDIFSCVMRLLIIYFNYFSSFILWKENFALLSGDVDFQEKMIFQLHTRKLI